MAHTPFNERGRLSSALALTVPDSILLAETDPRTLDVLSAVLSDHIPHMVIETCTTVGQLVRNLEETSYGTVAINPTLLYTYRFVRYNEASQVLVPFILTVCQKDLPLAHTAFTGNVFDLIVKPIVPQDAAQTVSLALCHHRLRKLLTLKEQEVSQFQPHNEALDDQAAENEFLSVLHTTYQTLKTSFRLLLHIEHKSSLRDVAASVERRTRQMALDRLLNMYKPGQ